MWVYQGARSVLSFLRAVPDVVFALIFVTAVGLEPLVLVLIVVVDRLSAAVRSRLE